MLELFHLNNGFSLQRTGRLWSDTTIIGLFFVVRDIRFKKQEIKKVDKELKVTIKMLGMQLETMQGIDTVTSSAFIKEIGDIHRFANSDKLARYAGIAPIKMGSGGKETMKKTKQGNRKLYDVFYNLAVQQVQVCKGSKIPRNPVFYAYYNGLYNARST